MDLIQNIKEGAKKKFKKIVLPEGHEERTLRAADIAIEEKIADIIILGEPDQVLADAKRFGLKNVKKEIIINPKDHEKKSEYIDLMVNLRKNKGLTVNVAKQLIEDPLYLGTVMIKNGDADGEVAGADNATGDVLKPAFQFVKTRPGISVVSGAFVMILKDMEFGENGMLVFADCAVNPNPNEHELAEIAVATAHTTKTIAGFEPLVAMLSFSTKGSANHELVDKVISATKIVKEKNPSLKIDGELQVDAALIEAIGKKKAPGSTIAGKANVLIFPDLQSGNIAYKLIQRIAHAEALGPVLQGMAAPINDLSRGCSVNDIVNMIAVTANQAAGINN